MKKLGILEPPLSHSRVLGREDKAKCEGAFIGVKRKVQW